MTNMINDTAGYEKKLEQVVSDLKAFGFDSVRIITTVHASRETVSVTAGGGNIYAQIGSVDEWMTIQRQIIKNAESGT